MVPSVLISHSKFVFCKRPAVLLLLLVLVLNSLTTSRLAVAQTTIPDPNAVENTEASPIRLRTPRQASAAEPPAETVTVPRYVVGEFERFVQRQSGAGPDVRRFGADVLTALVDLRGAEFSPLVPADYVIAPGDEVLVTLWGSVDADLRLIVDRGGRINVPRVGAIQVSGLRYESLQGVIAARVAQTFKNFQISATLGQLRGIRVFVSGFATRPGSYTISSLSTAMTALLRAGGPAAAGSFRDIQIRRGGQLLSTFDLYDLLLKGDRAGDRVLQAGDVVHVGAVGPQVGFIGSVNKPAVLELKSGETVAQALAAAGGFSAVADRNRLAVERLQDRNGARIVQLQLPADLKLVVSDGDVLRAFSAVDIALPSQRQNKRVRVEGEVNQPAEYVLPETSTVGDALRAAGGLSRNAFAFAAEFTRESVRLSQQENYERALRDLETEFARFSSSQRVMTTDESTAQASRAQNTATLIERLRAVKPSGRIVLQLQPGSTELPDLVLEDGDRLYVPARPTTVGVFGSVFNPASYLYQPDRLLDAYVQLAGGPTKGADEGSIFVVRANGNVVSTRQNSAWFRRGSGISEIPALPGDTIFIPEEINKTTFIQSAKDWTLLLYQLGIGLAGLKSATR